MTTFILDCTRKELHCQDKWDTFPKKGHFLLSKFPLKTLPKKQEIAFESTLNPRA